jgi:hypothetical protein
MLLQSIFSTYKKFHPPSLRGFWLWIQGDRNGIVAFKGAILWPTIFSRDVFARTTVAYVLLFRKHMRSPLMASFSISSEMTGLLSFAALLLS